MSTYRLLDVDDPLQRLQSQAKLATSNLTGARAKERPGEAPTFTKVAPGSDALRGIVTVWKKNNTLLWWNSPVAGHALSTSST